GLPGGLRQAAHAARRRRARGDARHRRALRLGRRVRAQGRLRHRPARRAMTERDPLVSALHEARGKFLELVAGIRPDLHRYGARRVGWVADGEDMGQEPRARAYYALSEAEQVPALRPWLFHIAHNRALDHLRRYDRRMGLPLEVVADSAAA